MSIWYPRKGGPETPSGLPGIKPISHFFKQNQSKENKALTFAAVGFLILIPALIWLAKL